MQVQHPPSGQQRLDSYIKLLTPTMLNDIKFIIKPHPTLVTLLRALVAIQGCDKLHVPCLEWDHVKACVTNHHRFLAFLRAYDTHLVPTENLITARQILSSIIVKPDDSLTDLLQTIVIQLIDHYDKKAYSIANYGQNAQISMAEIQPQQHQGNSLQASKTTSTPAQLQSPSKSGTPNSPKTSMEKKRLHERIQEHKRTRAQLEQQESLIRWQIEREVKRLQELEHRRQAQEDFQWHSEQSKQQARVQQAREQVKREERRGSLEFRKEIFMRPQKQEETSLDTSLVELRHQAKQQAQLCKQQQLSLQITQQQHDKQLKNYIKGRVQF